MALMYWHLAVRRTAEEEKGTDGVGKISRASGGALEDTTGWRALETNLYGVASFVKTSSHRYFTLPPPPPQPEHTEKSPQDLPNPMTPLPTEPTIVGPDVELLEAITYCCITHINRHVRAAGINVLEQMVHASTASPATSHLTFPPSPLHATALAVLTTTLADGP